MSIVEDTGKIVYHRFDGRRMMVRYDHLSMFWDAVECTYVDNNGQYVSQTFLRHELSETPIKEEK
jgi:hypothetical protein